MVVLMEPLLWIVVWTWFRLGLLPPLALLWLLPLLPCCWLYLPQEKVGRFNLQSCCCGLCSARLASASGLRERGLQIPLVVTLFIHRE